MGSLDLESKAILQSAFLFAPEIKIQRLQCKLKLKIKIQRLQCKLKLKLKIKLKLKLQTQKEISDAFIIFDEAYEGNDVDAFYLGDILRALGCKCTDAVVRSHGGLEELGQKRITFAEFGPILEAVNADLSSTGYACDYVEGLKIFDKDG